MPDAAIPDNLRSLHDQEEALREKALDVVTRDGRLQLHLRVIEQAMDLADLLRQFPTEDEDLKVIQVLGMRTFNALGAALNLALSGYGQNSALIMRDILETLFLLDLFEGDPTLLERWRLADDSDRRGNYSPFAVRKALDERDGFEEQKRAGVYRMFSELAAHPTMKSAFMMRPLPDADAVIGPFVENGTLAAVLSEMGRLAVQVGDILDRFFPETWSGVVSARVDYANCRRHWLDTFYSVSSP